MPVLLLLRVIRRLLLLGLLLLREGSPAVGVELVRCHVLKLLLVLGRLLKLNLFVRVDVGSGRKTRVERWPQVGLRRARLTREHVRLLLLLLLLLAGTTVVIDIVTKLHFFYFEYPRTLR